MDFTGGLVLSRLGVDLGTVRIGIALSDELEIVASPHTVIKSRGLDEDAESVARLAQELEVCEIVVGMPRNMKGTYGPAAERVRDFCNKLEKLVEVPILTWDERLSTAQASRVLIDADLSRKKRKGCIDKSAAAILLQSYLDRAKNI